MFSAWSLSEWIQSLLSITFIFSVLTGLSVLVTKTLVRRFQEEPATVIPFPAAQIRSAPLLKKAA